MRIAFFADIHGNLPALEAVIADSDAWGCEAVYCVGDQINRCPWSNEVLDLIAAEGWLSIAGNHEQIVGRMSRAEASSPFAMQGRFADLWWTWANLAPRHMEKIHGLPEQMCLEFDDAPALRLFHGLPDDPFIGISPTTDESVVAQVLEPVAERVVICAHTHRPLHRQIDGQRVLNPGSVGMPYNGDPRAHYLILEWGVEGWNPIFRRVAYPYKLVGQAFEAYGLLETYGGLARLHLKTVLSGEPWASDFAFWVKHQSGDVQDNLDVALDQYYSLYGPGHWYFSEVDLW